MATFVAGQPYTGKVIDPSQGGAVVDYTPNTGSTTQAQQQQQSGVQLTPSSSAITPSALTPAAPMTPVTAPPVTAPTAPTLVPPPVDTTTPTAPLPQESAIYKMMQDLQGNTTALGSEQAFRNTQDAKYGVTEKQGLVNSLKNQFDGLTSQAEGLRLQQQQNIQNIQNAAQQGGANVTRGGIAPQERASQTQTNQQLLTLGIQQHQIAAQHALASGDLATAISLSDRAVKMEYQPKKDALDAQRANIELLLKDPTLTLAQQKRAEDAKKANDAAQEKLKADTKDKETIQGLILQAVQNGAPAALINKATQDGTIFGTAGILSGYTAKETAASIQEYQFAKKNGYTKSFSEYQNEDANRKVAIAKAGVAKNDAGLTPYQVFTATQAIAKDNQKRTENAREISRQVNIMQTAFNSFKSGGDKNVASQAIISTFNKILDPTSVVRESEYDRTAAGQALLARIQGKYDNIAAGGAGVTAETLQAAVDLGNQYLKNAQDSILEENKRSNEMAKSFGLNSDFTSTVNTPQQQQTPQKLVEQAVMSSGKSYQSILDNAPKGQVAIVDPADGQLYYVPVEELKSTDIRI